MQQSSTYKQWLDNEYAEWVKALQESTVHNFKEHPVVKRMLGEISQNDVEMWIIKGAEIAKANNVIAPDNFARVVRAIDEIGMFNKLSDYSLMSGTCARMVYYACEILSRNPSSICEIGGGVGQFYAILRALGWKGEYIIYDLPEVMEFQKKYLSEVEKQTGLNLSQGICACDLLVSFYALGEFADEMKERYKSKIILAKHGYIAWNPHSGASDDLSLFKHDIKVTSGLEPGIKIIQW